MRWSRSSALVMLVCLPVVVLATTVGPGCVLRWGSYGIGAGQFRYPAGLAIDSAGNLYVTDTDNGRIQKFDGEGHLIATIGTPGSGQAQLDFPRDVEVGPDGNVYVADTENHRVQVFSASGAWIATWGGYGTAPGQMGDPDGIAIDQSGNVYVADPGNGRIQKFSSTGLFMFAWSTGTVNNLSDIEVGPDGNIYGIYGASVVKYSPDGTFLLSWGGSLLGAPRYLAVGNDGTVWVTDPNGQNEKIFMFSGTGKLLRRWGYYGNGNGQFNRPTGIQTDANGNLYIAQSDDVIPGYGLQDIQKFSLVPTPTQRTHWGELKKKYR